MIHDWTKVDAGIYHDFHFLWMAEIRNKLNAGLLPGDYYALVEQDICPANPDVLTLQLQRNGHPTSSGGGGVLLQTAPPQAQIHKRGHRKIPRRPRKRIAIRHISGDNIVAMVELVSPGNKDGRQRFREFVDKCVSLLRIDVHLLVIDPFPAHRFYRKGIACAIWYRLTHTSVEQPANKSLTFASFVAGDEPEVFIEPLSLGEQLPMMPLFLNAEMYVNIPLEETYASAWAQVLPHHKAMLSR